MTTLCLRTTSGNYINKPVQKTAQNTNLNIYGLFERCSPAEGHRVGALYAKVKRMPRISSKHQVTLPVESLEAAGLMPGDEVVIEAEGSDRIVVHRAASDLSHALGVFDGLYEPGYLDRLRSEERL
jgi:bifunctional DNA-binding transcriptional regulator/antitoxin component of YhaV-PrlF toxin-antitoxin module